MGYLLFVREGSLMAQPFDHRHLALAGEAVPIAEGRYFSVSESGVLAYRTGSPLPITQLRWFDRTGKMLGTVGEPGQYDTVALSPDGTKVAVSRDDPPAEGHGDSGLNTHIWLYEFGHGTSQHLTFGPATDGMAVWSPDGSRIGLRTVACCFTVS
jgi:Tol biopolymer transport system component